MNEEPILIGITGNFGSGKSTFCSLLREAGYRVISSDEIAQKLLNDTTVMRQLQRRWGQETYKNNEPDRKLIAGIVFSNKVELDFLNSLVHPKTLIELQTIVDNSKDNFLFFEIPLLFEAGLQQCFDYIILIRTDRDTVLKRMIKAGKATREELKTRLDAQIDDLNKIPLCDLIVNNDGSLKSLNTQLKEFLARLADLRQRHKIPFSS